MLFNNYSFAVMKNSLDGLSMQQQTILHNLANLDTPGYKAKSLSFEDVLHGQGGKYDMKATIVTDDATSLRPDGNNVDADTENMKLYQNYVQQVYLYQKIGGQFTNLRYVLNQSAK